MNGIEALADYFTGFCVAHHSICLGLHPPHNLVAKKFFEIRELLGVRGYDSKEQAVESIKKFLLSNES